MMRLRVFLAAALAVLLAAALAGLPAACGPQAERSPEEVTEAYFRFLGRDPARGFLLLTDDFHERHGLTVRSLEGWLWTFGEMDPVERPGDPMLAWSRRPPGLQSAREAWLMVQRHALFHRVAPELRTTVLETDVGRERTEVVGPERAEVVVRIHFPRLDASIDQKFELVRSGGSASWRIDRITQSGVRMAQVPIAFVTNPHAASLRALRVLEGRRPRAPAPAARR